ncbi:hypothetical protein [Streptomyces sp. NPDC057115]|uniref:hypothetical protein n=1 Tax=Streptomyces sp. NPDC057115 TaxID=3346022 RepID=UPI003638CC9F
MSAPLVVNTRDGVCWTRRFVTRDGLAMYAPESVRTCPEFVMATLPELAEQGIVGSAFALPMPEASNGEQPVMRARGRVEALVSGEVSEELEVRLDDLLAVACEPLRARVAELEENLRAVNAGWGAARDRVAELEARLAEYDRPADEDPIAYALTEQADDVTPQVAKLRALLAGQATDGSEFFEPGHAYTHRPGPDDLGGPRLRFYCESVTTDRDTGQPVARGWGGRRYGDRWTSVQRARGLEEWRSGQWVDTTAGGDQ